MRSLITALAVTAALVQPRPRGDIVYTVTIPAPEQVGRSRRGRR
jgi:hypothetical protein